MVRRAKFNVGDLVQHKLQGYRAVVVDVDPIFQASGRYNPQACKHAFALKEPWYRLLVDDSQQVTYVKEGALEEDHNNSNVINNPNVSRYLIRRQGHYQSNEPFH